MEIGIGSYAFRYAIGTDGFTPEQPMGIIEFAQKAHALGYSVIQLCENLKYESMSNTYLEHCAQSIKAMGLTVEIGMNKLSSQSLQRHLEICTIFDSHFLRIVVGDIGATQQQTAQLAHDIIAQRIPFLKQHGITIGIENHFDLTTQQIVTLVQQLNVPCVQAIYDTTNSIGFLEKPEDTLQLMLPVVTSLHLKDYSMQKAEASYVMQGEVLGQGSLDVKQTIDTVQKANADANCIVELTIRRSADATIEMAIAQEYNKIVQSTQYLKKLLK